MFTSSELAELRETLAFTAVSLANIPAVGGLTWDRIIVGSGDGIHTKPTDTPESQVTGSVIARLPMAISLAIAQSGQRVPIAEWWFVASDVYEVQAGDRLVSVSEPNLAFTVNAANMQPGYIVASLTQSNARQL